MSCAGPEPQDSAIAFYAPIFPYLPELCIDSGGTSWLQPGYLPNISREDFMRSMLLWAIGIPLPIIIILWLVTGHA